MSPISPPTGHARHATIEWATGQRAKLTAQGWTVSPDDPTLAELLNGEHSLAAAQAKRGSLIPPDLMAYCAKRAALATGAQVIEYGVRTQQASPTD